MADDLMRLVRRTATGAAVSAVALLALVPARPADAAAPRTTVSNRSGLNPSGDKVTVSGTGFDTTKGIYVAVCVDNGPGRQPTPCLGGADTGGTGSGSVWISSNPPSYATGLTRPYGPGGTFTVTLSVLARDPITGTDCTRVRCAVVTRADHTRSADRSQDTRIPITFAASPSPPGPPPTNVTPAPPPSRSPAPSVRPTTTTAAPSSPPASTPNSAAPRTEPAAGNASDGTGVGFAWWLAGAVALLAAGAVLARRLVARRATDEN